MQVHSLPIVIHALHQTERVRTRCSQQAQSALTGTHLAGSCLLRRAGHESHSLPVFPHSLRQADTRLVQPSAPLTPLHPSAAQRVPRAWNQLSSPVYTCLDAKGINGQPPLRWVPRCTLQMHSLPVVSHALRQADERPVQPPRGVKVLLHLHLVRR